MTVKELIAELATLPQDAEVTDYRGWEVLSARYIRDHVSLGLLGTNEILDD